MSTCQIHPDPSYTVSLKRHQVPQTKWSLCIISAGSQRPQFHCSSGSDSGRPRVGVPQRNMALLEQVRLGSPGDEADGKLRRSAQNVMVKQ